jgi:hypothetical protein
MQQLVNLFSLKLYQSYIHYLGVLFLDLNSDIESANVNVLCTYNMIPPKNVEYGSETLKMPMSTFYVPIKWLVPMSTFYVPTTWLVPLSTFYVPTTWLVPMSTFYVPITGFLQRVLNTGLKHWKCQCQHFIYLYRFLQAMFNTDLRGWIRIRITRIFRIQI